MKILMVIIRWEGGVGRYVLETKKALEKLGNQVKVLSREDDLNKHSMLKSYFALNKAVKHIQKKWNYDVLFCNDWSIALPLLFRSNKKNFACFHGNQLGFFARNLQALVGKIKGRRLIVVGDSLQKRFRKANMIYEGVNYTEFKDLKEKRQYLGFMNKATELFSKQDMQLLADRLKLKLTIAENIPKDKMNDWYNKLNVFISLPPVTAGFNLCWLEAMAAGVPIVFGNDEGIGLRLPITKVKHPDQIQGITKIKKTNYRKWLKDNNFTWDAHGAGLDSVFKKYVR